MYKRFWEFARVVLLFASVTVPSALAQSDTIFIARMAMRNHATYHYVEVMEGRGRWIVPDVYYIDFGSNKYREVAIGGGAELFHSKHVDATQEVYLDQTLGPNSNAARYLVPWTRIGYMLSDRVRGETVYFTYFPLDNNGRIQQILERAKLEYYFQHFKVGAGYGGFQFGGKDWQQKPFLTATIRGRKRGDLEFWLQRLSGNHVQGQVRYRLTFQNGK